MSLTTPAMTGRFKYDASLPELPSPDTITGTYPEDQWFLRLVFRCQLLSHVSHPHLDVLLREKDFSNITVKVHAGRSSRESL